MTDALKHQIVAALQNYITRFPSQNQAANSLPDVSAATLSNILNGKWDSINEKLWRRVAKHIGFSSGNVWQRVETTPARLLNSLLGDAQRSAIAYGIVMNAGGGKTDKARDYAANNANAFYVGCHEFFNRKTFLSNILQVMGKDTSGTVHDMLANVVRALKELDEPLLILDEFDKLNDQVTLFFITLFNLLENDCGIVIMATDHLKKRIEKGVHLNKKGFNEIYSRIGRKFIELKAPSKDDIKRICQANGVTDEVEITRICNESEGDLRRVKRAVHKHNLNAL